MIVLKTTIVLIISGFSVLGSNSQVDTLITLDFVTYNSRTGDILLEYNISIKSTAGYSIETYKTDSSPFILELPRNDTYSIQLYKENYSAFNYLINPMKDSILDYNNLEYEFFLKEKKNNCGELPSINFKHDSCEISPQISDSLVYVYDLLVQNPSISINCIGHRNTSELEFIGLKRAVAVKNCLIKKGIEPNRLDIHDKSDQILMFNKTMLNKLQEKERLRAEQLNRRCEFAISKNKPNE